MKTAAERKAEAYAARLREAGWEAEVKITDNEPVPWSSRELEGYMLEGTQIAHLWATDPYGEYISAGWRTRTTGPRKTTAYLGGARAYYGRRRKLDQERDLRFWVRLAEDAASYRKEKEEK